MAYGSMQFDGGAGPSKPNVPYAPPANKWTKPFQAKPAAPPPKKPVAKPTNKTATTTKNTNKNTNKNNSVTKNAGYSGGGGTTYSTSYSGGGGSGGGGGGSVSSAPVVEAPKPISFEDYLKSNTGFIATQGSADRSYDEGMAQSVANRNNLNSDYYDSFQQLGLNFGENPLDDNVLTDAEIAAAQWDAGDANRGYGQGFQALQNSAASRGMRGSSFYADELTDFNRSYEDQRAQLLRALASGTTDLGMAETGLANSYRDALTAGVNDAAAQYALQFGVDNPTADAISKIIDGRIGNRK